MTDTTKATPAAPAPEAGLDALRERCTEAREAGYAAYSRNSFQPLHVPAPANPYSEGSLSARSWDMGWSEARAEHEMQMGAAPAPEAGERFAGFARCDYCGRLNYWVGEPPHDCECGESLRESVCTDAPARPAPAPDDAAALPLTDRLRDFVYAHTADNQRRALLLGDLDALAAVRAREGAEFTEADVRWAECDQCRAGTPTLVDAYSGLCHITPPNHVLVECGGNRPLARLAEAVAALRPARDDSTEVDRG